MDALSRQHVRTDQRDQRRERRGASANPVSQRRDIEIDAFARIDLTLTVQRLVLGKLRVQHHGQQIGTRPAAVDRVEWRRWLGDGLASAAREFLPHRLDHLPLARHHFQGLGDGLAKLAELAATARAGRRSRNNDALTRQVCRQRGADRFAARELSYFGVWGRDGGSILARGGFQLFQLQLHLVEQFAAAFR